MDQTYTILEFSKKISQGYSFNEEELQELTIAFENGLENLELNDASLLDDEIQEMKGDIQKLEKKQQSKKAFEKKKQLDELESLQQIQIKLNEIKNQKCSDNLSNNPKKKQGDDLIQNKIKEDCQLYLEIQDGRNQIESLQQGQIKNGSEIKNSLEANDYFTYEEFETSALPLSQNVDKEQLEKNESLENGYQNYITKLLTDQSNLKQDISLIPECSEKLLLQIIYCSVILISGKQQAEERKISIEKTDIFEYYQSLSNNLKTEGLTSKEIRDQLQQLWKKIETEDLVQIIIEAENLLKKLRPLNIPEMCRLISKTNDAARLIQNQEIVLFLGGTGTGKSTTIHFLAGSQMVELDIQVKAGKSLKYIGVNPKNIKNKALLNVTIGPQAESETRYIAPVTVNFQDVGMQKTGSIILCDAPGFGDTAGPEVDISNGIGMIEAIKGCKSVRPVILASQLSIGDKGEGIKRIAHILVGLVIGIQDKLDSFSYLFTKYPPQVTSQDIHAQLLNIKNSVDKNMEERADEAFIALFEDLLEKTEEGAKKINPLTEKPSVILKQLIRSQPIQNPKEAFKFSITEKSMAVLQEQVRLHQLSIISAAKRNEYKLIKYKLDEMKFLIETLDQDYIKQAYAECINFIIDELNRNYNEIITQFNRCLNNSNLLRQEDLIGYQQCIAQFKDAESLRDSHLGTNVVSTSSLIQNLVIIVENTAKEFNQLNLDSNSLSNNLNNIKLIADQFKQVEFNYKNLCQFLEAKFKELILSSQQALHINDFNRFAEILYQIKTQIILLKNHLDGNQMQIEYDSIANSLISHLNQFCISVDSIFRKEILEDNDIDKLKKAIALIESAKETIELKEHINIDEVKAMSEQLNQKVLNYFQTISKKIGEAFNNEGGNSFKDIEILVKQMELIKNIQGIDGKTSELYYETVQNVYGYMQNLRRDAEQQLTSFHQQPDNLNYNKIFRCISGLKNAQWMNNIRKGAYVDIMRNITEDLIKHSQKLYEKLIDIELDLPQYKNIEVAWEIVKKIDAMLMFEQTITELTQYRENAHKQFKSAIQSTFNSIQVTFNLQSQAVYKQKQDLVELESIKSECEQYNSEILYLRENQFQSIDQLNEEISTTEQQNCEFLDSIKKEILKKQGLLDKLEEVSQKYVELTSQKKQGIRLIFQQMVDVILPLEVDNLLLKVDCKKIQDVYNKIEETDKEIQLLQDPQYANKYQNKIENLKQTLKKYNEILKSNKSSPQCEKFLNKKNYKNINDLNKEISRVRDIIQRSELNEQDYIFSKLDGNMAENAMHYLESCKKIKTLKEVSQGTFLQLRNYLVKYGEFMEKEMQTSFQKVNNATQNEICNAFGRAQHLYICLQEIVQLQKYQMVIELIKGNDIIQNWRTLLSNNLIQLTDQMNQNTIDKQDMKNKLDIVKAFSQIDNFLEGDKKYFDLFRQFQRVVCNQFKEIYKRILDLIEKNDFQNVAIELLQINENPLNEKALDQINHMLNVTLMDLVEKAKTKAIRLGNNLEMDTIQFITDNLNKIKNARNYFNQPEQENQQSKGYFYQVNIQLLDNGFKEIQEIVAKKIILYLERIEALINATDFYEAEEKREYINQVCQILGNYCGNEDLAKKIEHLQNSLEGIVESVLERYDKMPTSDYILNPPKEILDKLQKVASRSIKYTQSLNQIKEKIIQKIREILKDVKESIPDEKNEHIQKIESALCFIPEDIKKALESELQKVKNLFINKDQGYKEDFERIINSGDIKVVCRFIEKCTKDGMHNFQNLAEREIIQQCLQYKEKIRNALNDDNIKQALDLSKKLQDYREIFGKTLQEIENSFTDIQALVVNKLHKLINFIMSISKVENIQQMEKGFENFVIFEEFKSETTTNKSASIFQGVDFDLKIKQLYEKLEEYFTFNQKKYDKASECLNMQELQESVSLIHKWNTLLKQIRRHSEMYKQGDEPIKPLSEIAEKCKLYPEVILQVSQILKSTKSEILSFEFQQGYEGEINQFYVKLKTQLVAIQQAKEFKDHFKEDTFDFDSYEKDCIPHIKNKLQKAANSSIKIIEGSSMLSIIEINRLRFNYENIVSFEKNIRISDISAKKIQEDITQKVYERVTHLAESISLNSTEINKVSNSLIVMKSLSDNLPSFKQGIDQIIDESLKQFRNKNKHEGCLSLAKLTTLLESDPSGIGLTIIQEHKSFKGQAISLFNQQTQRHGIENVLLMMKGDRILIDKLRACYNEFKQTYDDIVKSYLVKLERKSEHEEVIIDELISTIKSISGGQKNQANKINWSQAVRDRIPNLMAHIFALWTLKNTEHYNDMKSVDNRNNYLLQPHPGQVISIFRMLGIGYGKKIEKNTFGKLISGKGETFEIISEDGLTSNLIEVGTGEGKSIILAVTSSILALFGVDVSCACYSEYLSDRDYVSFLTIFDSLSITQHIKYGPFTKICENIINQPSDVRAKVLNLINSNEDKKEIMEKDKTAQRPKILLIDEVDLFFSKTFYGNIYTPTARLKDPIIECLTSYLWKNRNQKTTIKKMEQTSVYQDCIAHFIGWEFIVQEALKDMLSDLTNFKHEYLVIEDKIAYKEHDGISFNIIYGYKTLFAYYQENENGLISKNSLQENIFIHIRCGSFSYSKIPSTFQFIIGVTGTLQTLNKSESEIVEKEYNIKDKTYIPSVFGENKRVFAKNADIYIENTDDYFKVLRKQIDFRLIREKQRRSVLVFFESKQKLMQFYKSENIAQLREDVQILTEEASISRKEKEMVIKRATTSGQITLLTRVFGRGTDFICRDQNVISNGGVHVIQTFFSEEFSEEIQIMGRTARQGQEGSFSMVLLDQDLEIFLGPSFRDEIKKMRSNSNIYEFLNTKRNQISLKRYQDDKEYIQVAQFQHIKAQNFTFALNKNNIEVVRQFLGEQNKGKNDDNCQSRTICLMDATGSMELLLNQAKNTVETMFQRAIEILKKNGLPEDCFQVQFVVYRDYDSKQDGILQSSPWESKPENLRLFLDKIKANGGDDYEEAIEIGLWHVNEENKELDISQVILIGDAPAKSKNQILKDRKKYGGEDYWQKSRFKEQKFYQNELNQLKNNNIPINTFYLAKGAKSNFEEIASATGGKCEELNINSPNSSDILTNIVTEQILKSIGKASGKEDQLVNSYRHLFVKSYK